MLPCFGSPLLQQNPRHCATTIGQAVKVEHCAHSARKKDGNHYAGTQAWDRLPGSVMRDDIDIAPLVCVMAGRLYTERLHTVAIASPSRLGEAMQTPENFTILGLIWTFIGISSCTLSCALR
jgi:hypothetical protein